MKTLLSILCIGTLLYSCGSVKEYKTIGSIERVDILLDDVIDRDSKIEIIGEGFTWSEGPLWVEAEKMLLFSDAPKNTIYRWTEEKGVEVYLTPSGYTGSEPSGSKEPGSNGLTLDLNGNLVMCQHGNRQVARMDAPLKSPAPKFNTIADSFEGKKFNSPNDLIFAQTGDLFFTDPPYGLPQQENDSTRELDFQGVFRVSNGVVSLVSNSQTKPNGLALLNDGKTLLVANSDPDHAKWFAYDITLDSVQTGKVFFDATSFAANEQGLPDGLKVNKRGIIFATGPGGLWIMNEQANVLGKIKLPVAAANCALSADEKTLYITAHNYLLRLRLRN